jgi:hypothetical protein
MVAWHGRKYRWRPWGCNENPHRLEFPFDTLGATMAAAGGVFFNGVPGAEALFSSPK